MLSSWLTRLANSVFKVGRSTLGLKKLNSIVKSVRKRQIAATTTPARCERGSKVAGAAGLFISEEDAACEQISAVSQGWAGSFSQSGPALLDGWGVGVTSEVP